MKFNFAEKIRVGYASAFFLLLLSYVLTFYTTRQLSTQNKWVNHTDNVINNLALLLSDIKDAETGYQGYIITGNHSFLSPYYNSRTHVDSVYYQLISLTSDNSLQMERLGSIHELINRKYALLSSSIEEYQRTGAITDSVKTFDYQNKVMMDSIRAVVGLMQQRENSQLVARVEKVRSFSNAIQAINITSLAVAILLALYSITTFNIENRAKTNAYQKAIGYQQMLSENLEDLKRANKELVELRSLEKFATTGRLARTIAHEVRNPLTNIGLAAEQLKSEIGPNEEAGFLLGMINRNGTRINQLITELLNSTKFSELKYEGASINDVIDETLEGAKDRMQLKNIRVEKKFADNLKTISVDKGKIKIAFLNIIVNAVEAMEANKGVLKIETSGLDGKGRITITDNGPGMDEEVSSRLFEPYFTNKPKGTGLGLTHAQNIILNHKGNIAVETSPGRGCTFIIELNFS